MRTYEYTQEIIKQKTKLRTIFDKKIPVILKGADNDAKTKGKRQEILIISPKRFAQYEENVKRSGQNISIVGKTKLKQINNDSSDTYNYNAVLKINDQRDSVSSIFEVRDQYKFSRVVGYIPCGKNLFIAIVKFNLLPLLVAFCSLLAFVTVIILIMTPGKEDIPLNRYLEDNNNGIVDTGQTTTRYRMNTTITVVKGTIQDINFENVNEGKYLRVKIKKDYEKDKEYIYDSGFIPFEKKVVADTLLKNIDPGTYETIAEVYVYDENENQMGQTNFEIKLIVK